MLDANDTTYFNVSGMLIYDPVISGGSAGIAPTSYFVDYWRNVSCQSDQGQYILLAAWDIQFRGSLISI
jgi:hypothetical protein